MNLDGFSLHLHTSNDAATLPATQYCEFSVESLLQRIRNDWRIFTVAPAHLRHCEVKVAVVVRFKRHHVHHCIQLSGP
jgi:hypothetical protein